MFNRLIIFLLLTCVIKTISAPMFFDPDFFHGRFFKIFPKVVRKIFHKPHIHLNNHSDELSTVYNNSWEEERPIETYTAITPSTVVQQANTRGRRLRSVESDTMDSANMPTRRNCIPQITTISTSTTTTTKRPFALFVNFGAPEFINNNKNSNEDNDKGEEEYRTSTDGGLYHNYHHHHEPCEFYPEHTTSSKFPFQGGLNFGANPFAHPDYNKDINGNGFYKPVDSDSLFRGGMVIGAVPFTTSTEIYEKRTTTETSIQNKAKYWCSKYQAKCRSREDASELKPRIIGGRPASPREHTHMVMIGYGSVDEKHWLCGGSLISSNFVLSAAHCTSTGKWGRPKWARMGDLDLSSRTEDARPQERLIVEHHNHPDYREPAVYHDIALYKLDSDVSMNNWVSPICLHTSVDIPVSQVVVTGWGRTDFVSETSPVLMEVEIALYNDSECKKLMDKNGGNKLPKGINSRIMVCAGVSQGGKDACSGDSGGPLIIETSKCSKVQIGITSIGRECGLPNSPGVYTRISHYIPWIESIVWPS